jgi:large subunit ribosomal protein L21
MFAILRTGGKQYRVGVGDHITVERIAGDVGSEVELADVLAIGGGESQVIGTPTVPDAAVRARIVQQPRGTKVLVFKKKRRKNYRRKRGHRQELTVLRIQEIKRVSGTAAESLPAEETGASPAGDAGAS